MFEKIDMTDLHRVTMFVDAHSVFYRLYKNRDIPTIYANDMNEFVSDIAIGFMNTLGHYRRYFATKLNCDNRIFVMFNRIPPTYNTSLSREFDSHFIKRYNTTDLNFGFTNRAVETAYGFIVELSHYIEGVYCIDNRGVDDFTLMQWIGFDPAALNIIFSRNMYATQLLKPGTVQLYHTRHRDGTDNSRFITVDNCFEDGVLFGIQKKADKKITPEMLPVIWAYGGCKDLDIPKLPYVSGIARIITIMNEIVNRSYFDTNISVNSLVDQIGAYFPVERNGRVYTTIRMAIDKPYIMNRCKALSIPLCAMAITKSQIAMMEKDLIDLFDENELERLNETLANSGGDPELLGLESLNMSCGLGGM